MSDPTAREAELLLDRISSGDLSESRLELAAYAGNLAAQRALGGTVPVVVDELAYPHMAELLGFVRGLGRWGKDALVLTAIEAAQLALPSWEAAHQENEPRKAIAAAEAYLRCPCEQHRLAARSAGEAAKHAGMSVSPETMDPGLVDPNKAEEFKPDPTCFGALAASKAASAAGFDQAHDEVPESPMYDSLFAVDAAVESLGGGREAAERTRSLISEELKKWALRSSTQEKKS